MSALGQKQTCAVQKVMSALPPKADMCSALGDVRFVPIADIAPSIQSPHRPIARRDGRRRPKQEIVKRLRAGPTSADEVDHWAPGTCGRPYNSQERSLCLRRVLVLRRER